VIHDGILYDPEYRHVSLLNLYPNTANFIKTGKTFCGQTQTDLQTLRPLY